MAGSVDYLVIGHVTQDVQPDGRILPGGTALFAGVTAMRLGQRVAVVSAAADHAPYEAAMPTAQFLWQPSEQTTTFVNRYAPGGRRTQHLRASAAPLNLAAVPLDWWRAPVVHLAPLVREIAPAALRTRPAKRMVATPQGWFRQMDAAGLVSLVPPPSGSFDGVELDALVLSEGEEERCARELMAGVLSRSHGVVIITRGSQGASLFHRGARREVPAFAVHEVDPTGAGDVFAAAYFVRRVAGDDPLTAATYASAAGALAVTGPGIEAIPDDGAVQQLLRSR